jgi:hypothetical protein
MNPKEFQSLASRLVTSSDPAEIRTAISRAYYAAYNFAVEVVEELGFRILKSPSGHGEIQNRLNNSGDPELSRVSKQLADLQSKRIQADYRLNDRGVENQKTASALVIQVDRMIQILETCRIEPKRQSVVSGIRKYEHAIRKTT